ncbi:MAG: hypothetical protein AAGD13_02935 [Pseudomonadota bacterium]
MRTLILALLFTAIAGSSGAFESRRLFLEHENRTREALIDAQQGVRAAPMLVVLHGGLAGPLTVRRRAGVTLARKGWVVAWPSAVDDWNDGRVDSDGNPYDTADDIGFLRKMVRELARRGMVDPQRVFVAGPSIGGVMALNLMCRAPDLVAGVAVAIASFPEGTDCQPGPPRPVLYIHGTDDGIMPPDGGRIGGWNPLVRDRGYVASVDETVRHIATRNDCDGFDEANLPDRVSEDESTVTLRTYQGCAEPVVHYVVNGGGHTWPGAPASRLGRWVGSTNYDFSATQVVEEFFQEIAGR